MCWRKWLDSKSDDRHGEDVWGKLWIKLLHGRWKWKGSISRSSYMWFHILSHKVYLVMWPELAGWARWDGGVGILSLDKGTVLFGRHYVFKHRWYLEHKKTDFHAERRGAWRGGGLADVLRTHCSASRSRRWGEAGGRDQHQPWALTWGVKEDPEGVDEGRQVTGPPLHSIREKPLAMSVTWWWACPCRLRPLSCCVMWDRWLSLSASLLLQLKLKGLMWDSVRPCIHRAVHTGRA